MFYSIVGATLLVPVVGGLFVTSAKTRDAIAAIVTALGYGTWGRFDIEKRVGGNPSQNTGVDYGKRIGKDVLPLIGGQLTRIESALDVLRAQHLRMIRRQHVLGSEEHLFVKLLTRTNSAELDLDIGADLASRSN